MKLAILTNSPDGIFQRQVIAGVREVGAEIMIDAQGESAGAYPRFMPHDADGFLSIANAAPHAFLAAALAAGKPVTLVSHHVRELPIPAVVFNNRQGILELVRHLVIDCGRRRLLFVRGIAEQFDAQQREAAFREALLRHSIADAGYISGDFDPETALHSLSDYMHAGNTFDGVIAADYVMAQAIGERLREMGRRVPDEVALVGFGDGPLAREHGITTVAADVNELGARAARQLLHQINGAVITGVTTLNVRLIPRSSSQNGL